MVDNLSKSCLLLGGDFAKPVRTKSAVANGFQNKLGSNGKLETRLMVARRKQIFLMFINDLPNSNFMKNKLSAGDTVLVQSVNNLGKLQNSVNCEMTKVLD